VSPSVSPRARAPTNSGAPAAPGVTQLPDSVRAALANRKK
jgi:hypothetical protein